MKATVLRVCVVGIYTFLAGPDCAVAGDSGQGQNKADMRQDVGARMREMAGTQGADDKKISEAIAKYIKDPKACPGCVQVEVAVGGASAGAIGTPAGISTWPDTAVKPTLPLCAKTAPYYDTVRHVCLSRTQILNAGEK